MDAKLSPDQGLSISGIGTASLLALVLTTAALILDGMGNRLPWHTTSLTMPLLLCAVGSAAVGFWVIPLLQALKTGQIIREDRTSSSSQKSGYTYYGRYIFCTCSSSCC